MVCCYFYPLELEVVKPEATRESVIEKTDIGGPTQVRSGAKGRRITICDAADRSRVIEWLQAGEPDHDEFVNTLAAKAEYLVSRYCAISATYHGGDTYATMHGVKSRTLKYGENPHQKNAVLYAVSDDPLALHNFKIVYGGPSSFVTETDIDRGVETVVRICAGVHANTIVPYKTMVAVKHGNTCGASHGNYEQDVIRATISGDAEAVLGAVVVCNFTLTKDFLELIFRSHDPAGKKWGMISAIACQSITPEALTLLAEKQSKCIVYTNANLDWREMGTGNLRTEKIFRYVRGGVLVQDAPVFIPLFSKDETFTKHCGDLSRYFTTDLVLAWAINATSNSNTITIVREGKLLGNAVGQQKRVASSKLAIEKTEFALTFGQQYSLKEGGQNAIAWGDSFFPYPDGIEVLYKAGVRAVFATHGSKRDEQVIAFCKENNMLFATYPDAVARGFYAH